MKILTALAALALLATPAAALDNTKTGLRVIHLMATTMFVTEHCPGYTLDAPAFTKLGRSMGVVGADVDSPVHDELLASLIALKMRDRAGSCAAAIAQHGPAGTATPILKREP